MTRLAHLPSGTTHGLDFLIPDNWSPEQALAVVELIEDLRARICMHYDLACMTCCASSDRLPTILNSATAAIHSD